MSNILSWTRFNSFAMLALFFFVMSISLSSTILILISFITLGIGIGLFFIHKNVRVENPVKKIKKQWPKIKFKLEKEKPGVVPTVKPIKKKPILFEKKPSVIVLQGETDVDRKFKEVEEELDD